MAYLGVKAADSVEGFPCVLIIQDQVGLKASHAIQLKGTATPLALQAGIVTYLNSIYSTTTPIVAADIPTVSLQVAYKAATATTAAATGFSMTTATGVFTTLAATATSISPLDATAHVLLITIPTFSSKTLTYKGSILSAGESLSSIGNILLYILIAIVVVLLLVIAFLAFRKPSAAACRGVPTMMMG